MSIIKILSDEVSNKIAAGEVIERPASVVKELVENALDAHASKIAIRIERAGTRLISVSDDGDGMDPDDAILCFEAHATSKISTDSDIQHISSFGFRGEAMPSIASVSHMTVRTRKKDSSEGFLVEMHGGVMKRTEPAGCAPGTETTVRELFCNVPARRKFLKSNATEERHIIETISVISLAHPETAFELLMDGRTILSSGASTDLTLRLRDIFGRDLADAMIPMDRTENEIRVRGYIAKRGVTRPTRQEQKIFVNGRPVEAFPVYRGIRDGCGPTLDRGRYQPAVIFLSMDPALVDVNVHPAKREVRFRNEFAVVAAVRVAVASAMTAAARTDNPFLVPENPTVFSAPSPAPEKSKNGMTNISAQFSPNVSGPSNAGNVSRMSLKNIMMAAKIDYSPVSKRPDAETSRDLFRKESPDTEEKKSSPGPQDTEIAGETTLKKENAFPMLKDLNVLGFLENTYIVATLSDSLVLIDQHAAHERVLFEKLTSRSDGVLSQRLLMPITLELSKADCTFLEKNRDIFEKLGFDADGIGGNAIKLNAIPAALKQDSAGTMFRDILEIVTEEGAYSARTDFSALAKAACTAAVKAHDVLTGEECASLLKQMSECELPFCCPHGRPTIINISVRELERRFGRKL